MADSHKSITLTPSWKAFFWGYVIGILLVPAVVGIVILWAAIRRHKSYSYVITDRDITFVEGNYSQKVDLVNIRQTESSESSFGVGNIILKTASREVEMIGLENHEQLLDSIDKAIAAEIKRKQAEKESLKKEPANFDPGSMDRLDYLTGLWQQGLVSDEDYKKEKKNFE